VTVTAPFADLTARLPALMPGDAHRLRRRIEGARKVRDADAARVVIEKITADLDAAEDRLARRRASVPAITYPEALPVSGRREEIAAAIRDHQVVVVAGETGSGKTTQIPKICLELGRGIRGMIGHTQPRRIAARTVSERIAQELSSAVGAVVGYQVRFTDAVGENSLVKVMTDGILLAEIVSDRMLRQYDTLIIDEAHERSLNIDFILGYLKQLLPRRPDLKVIITSATIDPGRFSRHFGDAPVIEVSGRTFPVEVRYRPVVDPDDPGADPDRDQIQAICDAVDELAAESPGDVLVFLSGEREIRDTAEALAKRELANTEVLPLYARLAAADQHRVFAAHRGRRIVLATNVAETSLTVPGIRYVIDPGTARISRYSHRTKIQRLPIEAVSQASANQRKGRCGRTSDGICIRLYTEDDFASRPEFTDPEILRTNLASVILAMAALGLGDLEDFPFLDPPDRRSVRDGVALLHELAALNPNEPDPRRRLTPLGRSLAALPVDPRLGRMVLAAADNGCLREVLVIAAGLSIQDPRERPADARAAADEWHARFADPRSDFLAYLNLWEHVGERQRELSSSQFRRACRTEFLNYLRIREWQDVHGQLRQITSGLGLTPNTAPAEPDLVHRSLLAGLLSHLGVRDEEKNGYLGARGAKFAVFPGSALFRKPPRWVMAAELVETSRLWARVVARVEPEWAESLAGHLVLRTYSEPRWDADRGAVIADEKVTLYGLPIIASRRVDYGPIDPVTARELFIRHALVGGEWRTQHAFFRANRALREQAEELEHRARRRGIVVDDETVFAFYDERIGAEVTSVRHFDTWWKRSRREQPNLLDFTLSMLVGDDTGGVGADDYPDVWPGDGPTLKLSYQFEPGSAADGVTVHVPLEILNQLDGHGFDWQVPGLREDLVTALIRSLPKQVRRSFSPAPNYAKSVLERISPADGPLLDTLGRELRRMGGGTAVPRDAWQLDRVPGHLRMTFRVEGERGRTLAEGKDLDELKRALRSQVRSAISAAARTDGIERAGLRDWSIGTVPRVFERAGAGRGGSVRAYPALADDTDSVAVRLFDSPDAATRAMRAGTRRLLMLTVGSPVKFVQRYLTPTDRLALRLHPRIAVGDLLSDCVAAAVDSLVDAAGGPAWDAEAFEALRDGVRAALGDTTLSVVRQVEQILTAGHEVDARLRRLPGPAYAAAVADVRAQVADLTPAGFVTASGVDRLPDLVRYLRAADRRLERLPGDAVRDRSRLTRVTQVLEAYRDAVAALPPGRPLPENLARVRWMIEELRVSLFAQALGTPYPVSEERIYRVLDGVG
jgi:ATP-dependent helicase HrpA